MLHMPYLANTIIMLLLYSLVVCPTTAIESIDRHNTCTCMEEFIMDVHDGYGSTGAAHST